jgi:hypothetical protein
MGSLIPNPNDQEILDKLNNRFSPVGLTALRQFMTASGDDTFNASRTLHRISYRLKLHPTSGARPRARWFKFLKDMLGTTNSAKIQKTIRDAVNDWNTNNGVGCIGLKFWAIYDPHLTTDYSVDVYEAPPDADGRYWVTITLVCNHEIVGTENGIPDPTAPENGEKGNPPAFVPHQPKAKADSSKKPYGKGAKKAAKKSGKKAAKKTGDGGS